MAPLAWPWSSQLIPDQLEVPITLFMYMDIVPQQPQLEMHPLPLSCMSARPLRGHVPM